MPFRFQMKEREAAIQSLLKDMEARLQLAEAAVVASDKEKAAALEKAAQAEARAEQLAREMVEATEQAMAEVSSAKETFQVRHGDTTWSERDGDGNERGLIQYRMQGDLPGAPRERPPGTP